MDWFRFYSDAINDRKFRRIAYETQQPVATVLGIWTIVLSIASESPVRGALLIGPLPANENDISMAAGCNVSETFQLFCETGLVTQVDGVWCVSAWDKRQYVSDASSDRVKAYRERVKSGQNGQNPPDVTLQERYTDVTVTPPEYRIHSTDNTADTVVSAAAPPELTPVLDGEKLGRVPKQKPDIGALVFDPVLDSVLVELLTAHYDSTGKRPPAKFQNVAQRDGYRMAVEFLGPDTTRKAITQCIVGNRYAIGQIVTSLLRWVDNEKRGGVARQNGQQPNEPKGYAMLRRLAKELTSNGI